MIVVTGATGHLGRSIVHKLVERVPASRARREEGWRPRGAGCSRSVG